MGRDAKRVAANSAEAGFQSTRPVWGATRLEAVFVLFHIISIHAPRMGRDSKIVQNI